jgi:hypothetical protein
MTGLPSFANENEAFETPQPTLFFTAAPKEPIERQIVRALAPILRPVGIRFKIALQPLPPIATKQGFAPWRPIDRSPVNATNLQRVWIVGETKQATDFHLLGSAIAKALRSLELEGCYDAIVRCCQVDRQGQKSGPEWRLQVDLTGPMEMLVGWAKWGDIQAIAQLLNRRLHPLGLQVSAALKSLTLHLFCATIDRPDSTAALPLKKTALDLIIPLLNDLAPQGIQAATIYGVRHLPLGTTIDGDSPLWVHWLDLPALSQPSVSITPLSLAEKGNEAALTFILERLLNPEIEDCFQTGGIGIDLLYRNGIAHIMSEAVTCPLQSQIASPVVKVFQQLRLPGVFGINIYGRTSGQQQVQWTQSIELDRRPLGITDRATGKSSDLVAVKDLAAQGSLFARLRQWLPAKPTPQNPAKSTYQPWQIALTSVAMGTLAIVPTDLALNWGLHESGFHRTVDPTKNNTVRLSFDNTLLETKLERYREICSKEGVPDILIVGSSRALRGIDPEIIRQRAIEKGIANPRIYNFGINGATAQTVDFLLTKLLPADRLPKLVIWADGARAFNSGRIDRTYNALALSSGFKQIVAFDPQAGNGLVPTIARAQASLQQTYSQVDFFLDRRIASVSPTYEQRDRFKLWMQASTPQWHFSHAADSSSAPVYAASESNYPLIDDRDVRPDGFLPVKLQFDPNTYYKKFVKVIGKDDSDYANFNFNGNQQVAFDRVVKMLQSRQIPLVFVNMPLTDIYLDGDRRPLEQQFKTYLQTKQESGEIVFIDLVGTATTEYTNYSDPSHVNGLGATAISNYLIDAPQIPWNRLLSTPR